MPIIETRDLTHIYLPGTPYQRRALDEVSLTIEEGEFVGIIGANGSGKSTLMQHFNGLLIPSSGKVLVDGKDTSVKGYRNELWKQVGLVFQFPEQQIFASTVYDEVAYGLKKLGLARPIVKQRVEEGLSMVGLDSRDILSLSPLCLNGGTRRQVALACILAMHPAVLVLDEPTAGLDPAGCDYIIQALQDMQRNHKTTVIMVSHNVNDLILLADKMAFLDQGKLMVFGSKTEVLRQMAHRDVDHLLLPDHLKLMYRLAAAGCPVNTDIITLEQATAEVSILIGESAR